MFDQLRSADGASCLARGRFTNVGYSNSLNTSRAASIKASMNDWSRSMGSNSLPEPSNGPLRIRLSQVALAIRTGGGVGYIVASAGTWTARMVLAALYGLRSGGGESSDLAGWPSIE